MSNYSTFFPTGGVSGSGSGIPVNGFSPILVSATGNPSGYDELTGVLKFDSGERLLKTGNTLQAASAEYPDATFSSEVYDTPAVVFDYGAAGFIVNDTGVCRAINGVDFVFYGRNPVYPNYILQALDPTGQPVGPSSDVGPLNNDRGICSDGVNYYMINTADNGVNITVFDGTTMQIINSFPNGASGFFANGIAYNTLTGNLLLTDSNRKLEITTAGVIISDYLGANVGGRSWCYDESSNRYMFFDGNTFVFTNSDATANVQSIPSLSSNMHNGFIENGNIYFSTTADKNLYLSLPQRVFGTTQAYIDMGSGQPLFLRIK
jgi:hypothetical protein